MSVKKLRELKNMSRVELEARLRDCTSQLFQSRLKHSTGQLEDNSSIWRQRKEVARIKTLLTLKTEEGHAR